MRRIILLLAIIIAGAYQTVLGQNVAVKTNLLNDAFLNPNIGIEVGLAPKWGIKELVKVLKSDDIKKYINDTYDGAVIPFEE